MSPIFTYYVKPVWNVPELNVNIATTNYDAAKNTCAQMEHLNVCGAYKQHLDSNNSEAQTIIKKQSLLEVLILWTKMNI